MRRATQGLLLAFLGAVLLRLALTDAYLRYVTTWMKWPIVASGVILLLLAIGPLLDLRDSGADDDSDEGAEDDEPHHDHVPHATWLLLLPGLVAFMIAPPALGSYLAERRAEETVVAAPTGGLPPLPEGEQVVLDPAEFLIRAQDGGETLAGRAVDVTGFVSYDDAGSWYVTQMSIACCAADATSYRVKVDADTKPPRDQWVTVSGEYVDGTGAMSPDGAAPAQAATLTAAEVVETAAPSNTYS